ncbi:MAG: hypothetical protein ACT4SY_14520 [Hyphomicrobiales bacterium]
MKHIPFDPDAPLVLQAEIDPWPDLVAEGIYLFEAHLFLNNRTDIQVESPLILFPLLGLDIRPREPMTVKPTMSGPRKLLACTASSTLQIAPHGRLQTCAIVFAHDCASGAFAFTPDISHRTGEDMGDFCITCATGAANFPLRRVKLQLSAATLRTAIDSVFTPGSAAAPQPPADQSDHMPLALSA